MSRVVRPRHHPGLERGRPEAVARSGEAVTDIGGVDARVQPDDEQAHTSRHRVGERARPRGRESPFALALRRLVGHRVDGEPGTGDDVAQQVLGPVGVLPAGELVAPELAAFEVSGEQHQLDRSIDHETAVQISQRQGHVGPRQVHVALAGERAAEALGSERQRGHVGPHPQGVGRVLGHEVEHGLHRIERDHRRWPERR